MFSGVSLHGRTEREGTPTLLPLDQILRVLVVRGDEAADAALCSALRSRGFLVHAVATGEEAVGYLRTSGLDAALVPPDLLVEPTGDAPAAGVPAKPLIRALKQADPGLIVIGLANGRASLSRCCAAVLDGADGFVDCRQGDLADQVVSRIEHCRQARAARSERTAPAAPVGEAFRIVGVSRPVVEVLSLARRAAQVSDAPVLISGETGTGKQLLAEAIHKMDPKRADRPFIPVNCASITGTLAESALFGHVKGAFTGADTARQGYFRAAHGGTLLLDEISELDPALQPKLLRVLQEGRILPVGADHEVEVDVRVIAATNRGLPELVAEGRFRMDLYQRLNVIEMTLPPLRQRPEDIPHLVRHFVEKYRSYYAHPITEVDPQVIEVFRRAELPGNVRALENTIRRMLAFKTAGNRLELADLPESFLREVSDGSGQKAVGAVLSDAFARQLAAGRMNLADALDAVERQILQAVLNQERAASRTELAGRLGVTRRTLYNKLRQHRLGAAS
jgi:DNA-binding NtrC family response regulator